MSITSIDKTPPVSGITRRKRSIVGSGAVERDESKLVDKAYDLILERILSGKLAFGAAIIRSELANELGMSMLPVSAAIQRLEHESLVESVQRVGTRVCIPTLQDIRGFYIVREALESQAARLFAQMASAVEKQTINGLAAQLDGMYRECAESTDEQDGKIFELRKLHTQFHRRIAEFSHCPQLLRAIEKNQILTFNWLYDRFFGRASLPEHWHVDLVKALASGDPAQADAAMRRHVQYQLDRLFMLLEPYIGITRVDRLTAKQ